MRRGQLVAEYGDTHEMVECIRLLEYATGIHAEKAQRTGGNVKTKDYRRRPRFRLQKP